MWGALSLVSLSSMQLRGGPVAWRLVISTEEISVGPLVTYDLGSIELEASAHLSYAKKRAAPGNGTDEFDFGSGAVEQPRRSRSGGYPTVTFCT